MKKTIFILGLICIAVLVSCSGKDGAPGQNGQNALISEVFELQNINLDYKTSKDYQIRQNLNPNIYPSDVILIYRKSGLINPTTPVWQPIPNRIYSPEGELDYDFDFSKQDFTIYASGNYNLNLTPIYITNQTFRIVIVPAAFSNRMSKNLSYEDVIAKYHIDDTHVKVLN